MSPITSSFDEPVPDGDVTEDVAPTAARERRSVDPRVLRSLLGGAAAVAVLGAGAAGFLWLSSTPSGDVADAALGGARSTPSVAGPVRATGVAFGARDVFATHGSATSGAGAVTTAATGAPSPGQASAGRATAAGTGSASTTAPPSTAPVTRPTTATPVPSASTTPPAVVPPPVSSAPGWTTPVVRFVGGTAAAGTFDVDGEQRTVALGQSVYPLSLVYAGTVTSSEATPTPSPSSSSSTTTAPPPQLGVLLSADDSSAGWIVPPDSALPDVVVGRTQGRVRVVGLRQEQFFLRVDRQQDALLAVGTAVQGTGLTFTGVTNDVHARWAAQAGNPSLAQGEVYFSTGAVTAFGRFGAGEADGVSY